MAYNSDGYIMIDFTEVDFRRTNQTIDGLYKRCVDVIGTNKFILVINANGRTPLPATCSFTNNQYVIDTCIYMFAISSNDNLFIRRNDVPASDIIDDSSISVDKTWSSNKIDNELDGKADTSSLADYQPLLTAGTNITIDENNVISSTGGAVIDDNIIVNNKVWSSLNTVEMLAPVDTVVGIPATFKTSLALPVVACKTSFTATQEAETPTPETPLTINAVDEIILSINGNNVICDLGGSYYGGNIDIVSGKLTLLYELTQLPAINYKSATPGVFLTSNIDGCKIGREGNKTIILADKFIAINTTPAGSAIDNSICINTGNSRAMIKITSHASDTITEINNYLGIINAVYELETPIEISLTDMPIIRTQIGNNSIASDSGAVTVSYKALPIDLL